MNKFWLGVVLAGVGLSGVPAGAADALADWAQNFEKPEIQQLILSKVFSGQIGSVSAAVLDPQTGGYLFPKNGSWARLGKDVVFISSTSTGGPYLVVSCMMYNHRDRDPVSAASYIFYDPAQRATAISPGYAQREQVLLATLTKLNRSFLVLVASSGNGSSAQTSATVLAFQGTDKPRPVWTSPMSAWSFRFGFSPVNSKEEKLILQATKSGESHYSAFSWSGSRFESDSSVFESRLKSLPDSVWQYGSGG